MIAKAGVNMNSTFQIVFRPLNNAYGVANFRRYFLPPFPLKMEAVWF